MMEGFVLKDEGAAAFQHTLHPAMMRAYFAAHAPDVPFHYEFQRVLTAVDEGNGQTSVKMLPETDLARIVRWRLEYADQMLAALREGAPE
jgi:hypothetical protein